MPIYEYRCGGCGHELEALQKLSDEPLKECPECEGALKRLISAPNFRLKGSGWYETDFKSDGDTKRNLADKGEAKGDSDGGADKPKADAEGASPAAKSDGVDKPKSEPKTEPAKTPSVAKPKPKPSATDSA